MEEARSLDTADRYVNCKCVKSFLRINEIDKAIELAGLFTRVSVIILIVIILMVVSLYIGESSTITNA